MELPTVRNYKGRRSKFESLLGYLIENAMSIHYLGPVKDNTGEIIGDEWKYRFKSHFLFVKIRLVDGQGLGIEVTKGLQKDREELLSTLEKFISENETENSF